MKMEFYKNLCYEAFNLSDMSFATIQLITRWVGDKLYIAFRSTDADDLRTHFSEFGSIPVPFDCADTRARVHGGWATDYKGIRHRLLSLLDRLCREGELKAICFVGHSYGGAVASLSALDVAYMLGIYDLDISLVTLNAPCMGNGAFVNALQEYVPKQANYVYGDDVVSYIPPWFLGYRRYKKTVCVGKRSFVSTVKNSLIVGKEMVKAWIKRQPFDYFRFYVAMDHMVYMYDDDMEVDL